ncbi:hypothetical protein GCM10011519_26730 [Marmoricola endophyticus]|uniref:DUF1345 domain-containing protein n=1 Tax=Marmoricola endophyticus TaxID=2040280 RepID=A0A917F5Z1_9ACTN|nr:DUF1345 domain-containing protein [Marmoricola endophyticus]GGF51368.1 hypothetical protein GCM10011519_26730 [Marmoricola endophyticus]
MASSLTESLLSESRRTALSISVGVVVGLLLALLVPLRLSGVDAGVLFLLPYLVAYFVATVVVFIAAPHELVRTWASRSARGSFVQRYVFGTAPGPGVSISLAAIALIIAMLWLPGVLGSSLPAGARVGVAAALVAVAWGSVVVSFAVAYEADHLLRDGKGLDFPGGERAEWSDYVYFAMAVMTTFGTTDVTVTSQEMRRTVSVNGVVAFVFNTVIVAALVTALTSL